LAVRDKVSSDRPGGITTRGLECTEGLEGAKSNIWIDYLGTRVCHGPLDRGCIHICTFGEKQFALHACDLKVLVLGHVVCEEVVRIALSEGYSLVWCSRVSASHNGNSGGCRVVTGCYAYREYRSVLLLGVLKGVVLHAFGVGS